MRARVLIAIAWLGLIAAPPADAYGETEVEVDGGLAPLKGTLCRPDGDATAPVVLILPGSGPTDRNGNAPTGLATDAYKLLAHALADNGFASLRIDKRAIAASAKAALREEDLRFKTYVDDTLLWTAFLKRQPRLSKIFLLGHSEGALIGLIAVQRQDYAGYISLAGVGFRAGDTLRRQLKQSLPVALYEEALRTIGELEAGRTVAAVSPELGPLFRPSVQPYLISWFKLDPAVEIAKLKLPVLIVQGTTDIQVGVEDARALAAAKPDAKLVLIDGMNHILRAAPADRAANVATYTQPALPLKPELVPALVSFIKR
jgi:alpha-beta hydrolase superfamily lysophospholipase